MSTGRRGRSENVRGGRERADTRGGSVSRGERGRYLAPGGVRGRGGRGNSEVLSEFSLGRGEFVGSGDSIARGGSLLSQSPGRRSESCEAGGSLRAVGQAKSLSKSPTAKSESCQDHQGVTAPVLGAPWMSTTRTGSPAFANVHKMKLLFEKDEGTHFGIPLEVLDKGMDPKNALEPTKLEIEDQFTWPESASTGCRASVNADLQVNTTKSDKKENNTIADVAQVNASIAKENTNSTDAARVCCCGIL